MVKRIGSAAWRVEVAEDGKVFSLGVRSEAGLQYEVLLGSVDSTPIVTDLLSDMARVHRALPPRRFAPGSGPDHPHSVPLRPLDMRIERHDGLPVLLLDFGGTLLKVEIDPEALRRSLSAL